MDLWVLRTEKTSCESLIVTQQALGKTAVWADPVDGASPLVWNRAVGWYFVSLIEVLDVS
jgi:fructose-1,6-bisphosphatase